LTDWKAQEVELFFVLSREFAVWHWANRFSSCGDTEEKEANMRKPNCPDGIDPSNCWHKDDCAPSNCWHKDNVEIDKELALLTTAKGEEFEKALVAITNRIKALILASISRLSGCGFHDSTHPGLLGIGMRELQSDSTLQTAGATPGRPTSNVDRNIALAEAVVTLREVGVGITEACDRVAAQLLTKEGVDGHTDNLTGRSVQRIYQGRDKSGEE